MGRICGDCRAVRALLSIDREDARDRVLHLYRLWYRKLPWIIRRFDIPKSLKQVKVKLREEFMKNKDVCDPRVTDMLVIRGHIFLQEINEVWAQKTHLMRLYKESIERKPTGFVKKFLSGINN